jgi:alcohol dehydrogenase class IV
MNQNIKTWPPAVTAVTAVDALITSIDQNNILDESENK